MEIGTISKTRIVILNVSLILAASVFAILTKALLPSAVNTEDFNSIFVRLLGFPVVASLYFVLIYTHCAVVTQSFGRHAKLANIQVGLRFGICFGLIFLLGMQEVVIGASPFPKWGIDFVTYQFFMGIGEAVAVLALCVIVAKYTIRNTGNDVSKENVAYRRVLMIGLIALAFTTERAIAYETGIISSDVNTSRIACYGWTLLFGIALGCCYAILFPIFCEDRNPVRQSFKLAVVSIGLNWIIFNSFIGWIIDGAMSDVLIRSGLDVIVLYIAVLIGRGRTAADKQGEWST